MTPEGIITHTTNERLRIRIPSRKRDVIFFENIKQAISNFEGVEAVDVNPLTGGILIIHKTTSEAIVEKITSMNLITFRRGLPSQTLLHKTITDSYSNLNNKIKASTGGAIDISGIMFLTLAGLGIYQISKGNYAAPAWYTAFWYAMNIFLKGSKGNTNDLS